MSTISVTISGRSYAIDCDPGDVDQVVRLAATVDAKIREIGATGQSEVRQLLFAALFLADDVLSQRAASPALDAPPAASGPSPAALAALADRLEKCAAALEG